MAMMPSAEVHVDESLVRALLSEQHPDLAGGELRLVANGWDNALYRLAGEFVVRLPRRAAAAHLVDHEARWLPLLHSLVPIPIPVPLRVGVPTAFFPWSWTVARWIDGTSALGLTPSERAPLAGPLADALTALHVPAPSDAPHNPVRAVALARRADTVTARLASLPPASRAPLERVWLEALRAEPWSGSPVWVHGDPHPGNVLVKDGRLAALIDFGDISAGDPATDLAAAWMFFESDARAEFRSTADERRALSADDWRRARGWALVIGSALAWSSDDHPGLSALGAHTLAQVLID